jgi:hypothetical protein
MASPNNFLNRYSPFPYPLALPPWSFPPQQQLAFPPQMPLHNFPQHFAFHYILPQNYLGLTQLPPINNLNINGNTHGHGSVIS